MQLLGFILGPHLCKPLPWSRAQGQGCDNFHCVFVNTQLLFIRNPISFDRLIYYCNLQGMENMENVDIREDEDHNNIHVVVKEKG